MTALRLVPPSAALLLALISPAPSSADEDGDRTQGNPPRVEDSAAAIADPDAAARRAIGYNAELEALEARIEALDSVVERAGVWKDPMAGLEYSNVPFARPYPGGHPMSGLQLRVEQTFPGPGKVPARRAVAQSRTEVVRHRIAERRVQLAAMVRDGYHRLALIRQLRRITRTHVELVAQLLDVVRANYEVGRAQQHDLLRLELLRDRLTDDLSDLDEQERALLATLNATMGRSADASIETPDRTPTPEPPTDSTRLLAAASESRPLLAALAAEAEAERLDAERALREQRPDVTTWLGYRIRLPAPNGDPGENFVSLGASIPLPWFWNDERWGSQARGHRAVARALESERRGVEDELRGRVAAALTRWSRARQKATRYGDELVPLAQRTLDATLAAYRVGNADFTSLFQAELQLLDFERAIRMARADAARAAVEVDMLTGRFPQQSDEED